MKFQDGTPTNKIKEFLRSTGMASSLLGLDASLGEFTRQLRAGLAGARSSLMMIPTYISGNTLPRRQRAIALDAGGTNFRVALLYFDENGAAQIEHLEKMPMPGSLSALSVEEFFAAVADAMTPVLDRSDDVGFCFSFPAAILPSREGRILNFNKEIRIDKAEGALLGAGINAELRRRGLAPKRFTVLNDTVATLLCGMTGAAEYDGYIGYILGTGTNTSYLENAAAIGKLPGLTGSMIINMESGGYDGFPQGRFDRELDAASENPGDHKMEKMISGAYLGDLIFRTVRGAAAEGLFSPDFAARLSSFDTFSMPQISDYCAQRLESSMGSLCGGSADDDTSLFAIVDDCFDRAARMTAVNFAAILTQADSGRSPDKPACITAEGTTFYKSPLFREKLDQYIHDWIEGQLRRWCVIRRGDDATITGSAVAALQK